MGIFVDYVLRAECSEDELRGRLERVGERCMDLPLKWVGEVERIAPIYNALILHMYERAGHTFPEAIAGRYREAEEDKEHGFRCLTFGLPFGPGFSKKDLKAYLAPALALIERGELWDKEALPDKLEDSAAGFTVFSVARKGIEIEFASVLLRYGYMLILHPGEGSETVNLALSTFTSTEESRRMGQLPLWLGQSFTKTQYAKEFIQVHETVCRVLDIVQEEGLLLKGSDTCGYYAGRSWKKANKRVNEELLFARAVGGMMGVAIRNLREEGAEVQVVEDNASKAKPVDFSAALKREQEAEEGAAETRRTEDETYQEGDEHHRPEIDQAIREDEDEA